MIKKYFKRLLNDEFFLNRSVFLTLLFVTLISAIIIYDNPTIFSLLLFAFCVFLMIQNYFYSKVYKAAANMKVSDIMIPKESIISLAHSTTALKALQKICKSYQETFPVFYQDNLIGIIQKEKFLSALGHELSTSYISDYLVKSYDHVYSDESIQKLLSNNRLKNSKNMVVFDHQNNFLGLLSYDKVIEFLLLDDVIKQANNREVQDEFFL